jgi:hypothetical protein
MKPTCTRLFLAVISTGLLLALPLWADNSATTPALQSFELNFELKAFGLSGEAVIRLQPTAMENEYQYSSATRATGLARLVRPDVATETSTFHMQGQTLVVDEYRFDSGSGDKFEDSYARFDHDAGIVYSNHQEEQAEVPLTDGMLDRMSADLQVTLDLQAGRSPENYTMVHRNSAKTYTFSYEGTEQVETPAGTFNAVKYLRQREGSSRAATIWYAPELEYQPVKVVQLKRGKTNGTLLLKAYRFGLDAMP